MPFYRPAADSPEIKYLPERRKISAVFSRSLWFLAPALEVPKRFPYFAELTKGGRANSTTEVFGRLLAMLLRHKAVGKQIVPIIPDEARTFGLDALFKDIGIYAPKGQLYEPVDKDSLLYYNEQKNGQILEEGITEAGSMSSFIAAGTAYATHAVNMIPFYIYYSMFGFQRIGDQMWLAGDIKGVSDFCSGGTYGTHVPEWRGSPTSGRSQLVDGEHHSDIADL